MTLAQLADALDLMKVCGDGNPEVSGVYVGDFLSRAMSRVKADNVWITIMANTNVIAVASLTDCACVLLAEGVDLSDDALCAAQENGITVFSSQNSAYDLCLKIGAILDAGKE